MRLVGSPRIATPLLHDRCRKSRIDVDQCSDLRASPMLANAGPARPCGTAVLARLKGDIAVYKRILIATDGSAIARKAEVTGLELAKALNAEAIAVTVSEPVGALSMSELAERTMSNPIGNYEECVRAAVNRIFFRVGETANRVSAATRQARIARCNGTEEPVVR